MIAVIDYGMGNVSSILNMLKKIGVNSIITNNFDEIKNADKLILPGVGSFDIGMKNLKDAGLNEVIKKHAIDEEKPLLGICLGMQMLGRCSEEGYGEGLNFIPFDNRRFKFESDIKLKIPHMGWDIVDVLDKKDDLVAGVTEDQRYYFVHSYHAICDNRQNILMECEYGYPFAAAVRKGKIYGVQFHPEKSHKYGMALLDNFARRV